MTHNNLPRFGTHDSGKEFQVGDQVVISFGTSGQLGPGKISEKVKFANEYDSWTGYIVDLPVTEEEVFQFGWVGSSLLKPSKVRRLEFER